MRDFGMRERLLALAATGLVFAGAAIGATEQEKQSSILGGLAWLAQTQADNGVEGWWSYSDNGTLATTAAVALAFVEEGFLPGEPVIIDAVDYGDVVGLAATYVFNRAAVDGRYGVESAVYTRWAEDYNNNDDFTDDGGNGQAIYFEPGASNRRLYTTGLVVPLVFALGEALGPDETVAYGSPAIAGLTWRGALRDLVDWFSFAQVEPDRGAHRGGWRYDANYSTSDNSTAQWGALPLIYAGEWGLPVPQYVLDELDLWTQYIQNPNGGSGYDAPGTYVNVSKTGGLLLELAAIGLPVANPRVQAALAFIDGRWNTTPSGTWYGNLNHAYAMWAVYKGLQVYGFVDEVVSGGEDVLVGWGMPSAVSGLTIGQEWDPLPSQSGDWYSHYCDYLVGIQNGNGSWSGYSYWTGALATSWYINIINAAARIQQIDECVIATVAEPDYGEGALLVPLELGNVDPLGQEPITGVDVIFHYDPAILVPDGVDFGGTVTEGLGWGHFTFSPAPGEVRVGLGGVEPFGMNGGLVNLRFLLTEEAACEATTPLELDILLNEGDPCVEIDPDGFGEWMVPWSEISGRIGTWSCPDAEPVAGVELVLESDDGVESMVTDAQGLFTLPGCRTGCYALTPHRDCGDTMGITALDAALVLQHFAGLLPFDECPIEPQEMPDGSFCPEETLWPQMVAADVSGNGEIHSFDASIILQYLAGQDVSQYLVGCWRFICDRREFCVAADDVPDQDFVGLLYGDVTGSFGTSSPAVVEREGEGELAIGTLEAEIGETVLVPVDFVDPQLRLGLLFELEYDPERLTIDAVQSAEPGGCLLEWRADGGRLRVAMAAPAGIEAAGTVARIACRVVDFPDGQALPLRLTFAQPDEDRLAPALVDGAIQPAGLTAIEDPGAAPVAFALGAPMPNPFNPSTTVLLDVPAAAQALTLTVHDLNGRLVRTLSQGRLPAGRHAVSWDGRDERGAQVASGLYLLRLEAGSVLQVRKATLLK